MSKHSRTLIGEVMGLALGAGLGWLAGSLLRSDNVPFFVALGVLAGVLGGLAWGRVLRPRVLAVSGLLILLVLIVVATPPRARFQEPVATPTALAESTLRADSLTPDQIATLSSLQRADDYPLYTMRYPFRSGGFSRSRLPHPTAVATSWGCSLFAALGDPENRVFGRNFDWRYSPALLLFTNGPEDGYASVSMVNIAYLGFGDGTLDLTTLPLAERRRLLEAPSWPFDGMNEAGVAVGMAAVPQADERHDPGKPAIDSLRVMREILDRAGSVDEAVAILTQHNIAWEGGPPLHYLVADRSGRAALVEFHAGRIAVLPNAGPWHAATNFTRSAVTGDAAGQCHRYDTLVRQLTATSGALDRHGALDLLLAVAQTQSATQWSVVYGMSTGQVDVVMGRKYRQALTFRLGH